MQATLCRGGTEDIINQESTRAGNFCDISSRNRIFITLFNNLKSSRTNWRYIGISSIYHSLQYFLVGFRFKIQPKPLCEWLKRKIKYFCYSFNLQPDVADLGYFKLYILLDLIVNVCLHHDEVEKINCLKDLSLRQVLK